MNRRRLFTTALFAALAAALLPGRGALAALPGPRPRRLASGHYLVDGWVLTARDLEALQIDDR